MRASGVSLWLFPACSNPSRAPPCNSGALSRCLAVSLSVFLQVNWCWVRAAPHSCLISPSPPHCTSFFFLHLVQHLHSWMYIVGPMITITISYHLHKIAIQPREPFLPPHPPLVIVYCGRLAARRLVSLVRVARRQESGERAIPERRGIASQLMGHRGRVPRIARSPARRQRGPRGKTDIISARTMGKVFSSMGGGKKKSTQALRNNQNKTPPWVRIRHMLCWDASVDTRVAVETGPARACCVACVASVWPLSAADVPTVHAVSHSDPVRAHEMKGAVCLFWALERPF